MSKEAQDIAPAEQDGLTEKKSENPRVVPPVDVLENDNEILVIADLPGVGNDSLRINMDNSELLIHGTQSGPAETENWQAIEFYRTFRVPNTVDPEGISAELKQGVLHLHLKKREEAKPRQIEVKVL